ncbi:2-oxoglutarate dehydrogenase, E2 subunit, dihydrolipoamide succinyltransferase [Emticicia oligotrophica DSM 17448]|uniref:Dihydrolipoyllysine-residue succinyltransferase component of 2-oxoglutarate dehydrogenase complex n=1 Tax=Emticicia oligotrophica (strain DSM 17448 / CIP 109782 / MTCC 6937 / GPTSA100-15) TaxID=929562 RepID=A0ABM5MYC1_EMTOG|nr:2-oxoglutarate dehydrogenase complex dihydrolipoyllysine-residue succinyltransferase [Emticicia oligotrophica]AFK02161.1 2-oxoglutarate dehydrogenase, E2 subunit, dihydrolipoamide succinyltransferase [Emticicia oligotrophica DSM 17448]
MAIEMKVPSVGESVSEVTIASWTKKDGDLVKMDEVICELESDKATFELPAEADGILRIVAPEGTTLPIGALICKIEAAGSTAAAAPAAAEAPKAVAEAPAAPVATKVIDVVVPAVGESISEVTIAAWSKKEGDSVKMDEVICELESDKATFELPSPENGVLTIVAQAGQVVPIGGVVAKITVGGSQSVAGGVPLSSPQPVAPVTQNSELKTQNSENYAAGHPSPVAAKVLAEKGIDPASVQGTGVGGRITKDDAVKAEKPAVTPAPQVAKPAATPAAAPASEEGRSSRREKMTSLRKTIAKRLVAVKQETAMLTTFNEVDMKPIMDLRAKYKDKFKEVHGVGLGFMSFFTKACAIALKEFPLVNSYIDGDEIVYNDYADIAIAVSAPRGLVVPVIRSAEKLNFAQIESEVVRLAVKARENKLTIEEMTGGTFTITNGGIFGSMLSTPIINAPQSAILGMHNIVERPVVVNGEIVVRPIMYVALSYDHRTIDGKDSVSFLVRVKQLLEDPTRILLGV